jgi:hypothetical protein
MVAVKHPCTLEKLVGILPLMEEEPVRTSDNLDAEEVVKRAKILQRELSAKAVGELSKKTSGGGRQDDVVDVQQQVCHVVAGPVDKQGRIGTRGAEAQLMQEAGDALVPGAGRLLQSIQGPREQAHVIGALGVDEADGLLTVHLFLQMAMKEGVGDVHLMHGPRTRRGEVQHCADRARFDNRGKRIREVDASALPKTAHNQRAL